jgi:ACS family hexuronate transporter-like MFS transporter
MPGVRWQIAILLCLITTVNYVDRQAFAVVAPVITAEFSIDNTQFGFIVSAFLFAYAIGHLVAGPVIDRLGTKRAFSIAVVAWSVAGMLCAAGRGFWSFLSLRALLGAAEAANFPAALKSVSDWFPARERSLATGIVAMGPGLGALISPPLLGFLIIQFGWQWAFLVPGVAGFVWLWIWQRFYHRPRDHPRLGSDERALINADQRDAQGSDDRPRRSIGALLKRREMWGLMSSRFVNDGAFYFYVSWLPLYLSQARGFDLKQIAIFAIVPYAALDLGSLAGGWLGTRLIQGGLSLDRSRKRMIWAGALLVPLVALPAAFVESPLVALALIAVAMFAIQGKAANLFALPADLFPPREVGTTWGLFGALGAFGGMAFNAAAGWVTDLAGFTPVFVAVAVTQLLSAVLISWLIPEVRQI